LGNVTGKYTRGPIAIFPDRFLPGLCYVFGDNNIVMLLVDRDLAVRTDDKEFVFELMLPTCRISKKGAEIIEKGGWLKHLEREKVKSDRIEKKDVFDFKVSKFKYHTFWWFFGFAIIGLVLWLNWYKIGFIV